MINKVCNFTIEIVLSKYHRTNYLIIFSRNSLNSHKLNTIICKDLDSKMIGTNIYHFALNLIPNNDVIPEKNVNYYCFRECSEFLVAGGRWYFSGKVANPPPESP